MAPKRSRLQLLFDLAQLTFRKEGQPTAQQLDVLKQALSRITLEELGISGHVDEPSCSCSGSSNSDACSCDECTSSSSSAAPSSPFPEAQPRSSSPGSMDMAGMYEALPRGEDQPRPPITYLHIHEDATLSLGIFCLPARARIPLHNHPGMTVMSRVLYGQVHVASCDWLDPGAEGRFPREAVKVLDDVFCGADDPIILFPSSGGNIHQFTALTDCAVLDLMTPPYSTEEGRDCTYYRPVPGGAYPLRGEVALLDESEPPKDFVIAHADYHGQRVRPIKLVQRPASGRRSSDTASPASPGGQSASPCSITPPPSSGGTSPTSIGQALGSSAAHALAHDMARGAATALHSFA